MSLDQPKFVRETSVTPVCASFSYQQQDHTRSGAQATTQKQQYLHGMSLASARLVSEQCAWDEEYQAEEYNMVPVYPEEESKEADPYESELDSVQAQLLHVSEDQQQVSASQRVLERCLEADICSQHENGQQFDLYRATSPSLSGLDITMVLSDQEAADDDSSIAAACLLEQLYAHGKSFDNVVLMEAAEATEMSSWLCLQKGTVLGSPVAPENGQHVSQREVLPIFTLVENKYVSVSKAVLRAVQRSQWLEHRMIKHELESGKVYFPSYMQCMYLQTHAMALEQMVSLMTQSIHFDQASNRDVLAAILRDYRTHNEEVIHMQTLVSKAETAVEYDSITLQGVVPGPLVVPMTTLFTHRCGNKAIREYTGATKWTIVTRYLRNEWVPFAVAKLCTCGTIV